MRKISIALLLLFASFQAFSQSVNVQFSLIETSYKYAPESFIFKGGKLKKRRILHGGVFIEHSKGNILFDTGLGENINKEFRKEMSFKGKLFFDFKMKRPIHDVLKDSLKENTVKYIIPSHMHWDHTGGIKDFPAASVLVTETEYKDAFATKEKGAFFHSHFQDSTIQWKYIEFNSGPYEIFEKSFDVYSDGTLIVVPLKGHTEGSIGMFVNLPSGKRFFFTGDLTWATEAFERKAPKHPIPRKIVDKNPDQVMKEIERISEWKSHNPDVTIVPAHDSDVWYKIGLWPVVIK